MVSLYIKHVHRITEFISKPVIFGVLSILLLFIAAAGMYATSLGWWGNGDTVMHVDYAWQVSQGSIPKFDEAIQYDPYNEIRPHAVQGAAHHPPLYYVLISTFMSGLLESGQWEKAVAIGRSINIFIGILTLLALAWAGWVFGGSRKKLFAVLVPAFAVSSPTFIRTGGDVTPDMLALLMTVVTFVLSYIILSRGVSMFRLSTLGAVVVLGMLTKITFLPAMLAALAVFAVCYMIKDGKVIISKIAALRGVVSSIFLLLLVILTSGWFYYGHNYEASGSLTRAGSQEWISDVRDYKSLSEVITSKSLATASLGVSLTTFQGERVVILWVLLLAGVVTLFMRYRDSLFSLKHIPLKIVIFLLIMHYITLYAGQVSHAEGYGQISARYFFAGTLLASLTYAYGAATLRRLPVIAVGAYSVFNLAALYKAHTEWLATKVSPNRYGGLDLWDRIIKAVSENWVPVAVPYLLVALLALALFFMLVFIARLSLSEQEQAGT